MRKGTKRKAGSRGKAVKSNDEEKNGVVLNDGGQTVEENNHKKPEANGSQTGTSDESAAEVEISKKADADSNPAEKEAKKKKAELKRPAKRARVAKPQEEPEYFEEKRNLVNFNNVAVPAFACSFDFDLVGGVILSNLAF